MLSQMSRKQGAFSAESDPKGQSQAPYRSIVLTLLCNGRVDNCAKMLYTANGTNKATLSYRDGCRTVIAFPRHDAPIGPAQALRFMHPKTTKVHIVPLSDTIRTAGLTGILLSETIAFQKKDNE